ncbi:MAG: chemotaxis protein CheA [Paucimonas sp.]|jgi:two-component system chemotaxis sensor kinase CheA|nr:chemotaxis protein CheA [Paucimonas sp.]
MDDMLKEFVVEALDLANNVEEHLLSLERNPEDLNTLNAVFRSFHTIKGGAGFMNLAAMVSACHLTENLFDALRTGKALVTPLAIEAALQASGFVGNQLKALADGASPESLPAMPFALEQILVDAIDGKAEVPVSAPSLMTATSEMAAPAQETAAPAASVLTSGEIDWIALYRAVVPATAFDDVQAQQESAAVPPSVAAEFMQTGGEATAKADTGKGTAIEESIRIDAAKLDALLEIAGESVQAANQAYVLLEKLMQFKFEGQAAALMSALAETLGRASRYSGELQRASLSTRMQPVGKLFQKFPRLVRELAKDLGKDVELVIAGAETEVDRVVVDSLYDPLVHMLRNALDHGIEDGVTRAAKGKPAKAVISLNAWQEASSVMIELTDDGRGMDADELRRKAIGKGLIGESAAPSAEEAYQLIFLPGFSTKDVASSVSGRGVGMDVVKTAVEKHRGAIRIDSVLGTGTRFTIRLPIELSIVPTMLVRTSGAALGMPLSLVQRVVELPEELMGVGGSPVFRDQGVPLPVRSLGGVLGYEPSTDRVGVVISAPQPYILAVDSVEGTADLVIKPMTAMSVPGIAGTARSAEGELVLIVGLSFLLDGCRIIEAPRLAA